MYYKIVTYCSINDSYYSLFPTLYSVIYEVGKWTVPKLANSKLFVFDNLENAKKFKKSIGASLNEKIFSCDVEDINIDIKDHCIATKLIEKFWNDENFDEENKTSIIPGTVLVGKVKLLEERT